MAGMILYTSKTEAAAKKAFQAALAGDFDAVKKLIDHSFNTEDCDPEGNSLLIMRCAAQIPRLSAIWWMPAA